MALVKGSRNCVLPPGSFVIRGIGWVELDFRALDVDDLANCCVCRLTRQSRNWTEKEKMKRERKRKGKGTGKDCWSMGCL